MIARRICLALALAAFVTPCATMALTPKTTATHKPAVKTQKKCVSTKKVKCLGGPAPSHM
jgi:hypothetical protein